jgi:hypothetical protein
MAPSHTGKRLKGRVVIFWRMLSSLSCSVKNTTLSRVVMADGALRVSSPKTFSISACSCSAKPPVSAPASTMAMISSGVTVSLRAVGKPSRRNSRLAVSLYSHNSGRSQRIRKPIGPATAIAMRSGDAMPRRLGIRSANRMNRDVTSVKDSTKAAVSR